MKIFQFITFHRKLQQVQKHWMFDKTGLIK